MKVLGLIGSPRRGGNIDVLMKEAFRGAESEGAETTAVFIHGENIAPCDGCQACRVNGVCHIEDDMQSIYERMLDSDGIIFGTPVYFWTMSAQTKIVLDRTYCLTFPNLRLRNKIGGVIVVAQGRGCASASAPFYSYFLYNHMFATEFVYGYALEKGEIMKSSPRAVKAGYEMGRQMALLIKSKPVFPEEFNSPLYRMVDKKYPGLHSE